MTYRRAIRATADGRAVEVIDQTRLPHELAIARLETLEDAAEAIRAMRVRGAPLIGATAAFGLAFAMRADPSEDALEAARQALLATRPSAVNLRWAVGEARTAALAEAPGARAAAAWRRACEICEEDAAINRAIGGHGLALMPEPAGRPVAVLTHCNAGRLATVDRGTALSPVYDAHEAGRAVHVWVSETRPRNQGAALTAWELAEAGVPHTVIADNAAGHLMAQGKVDLCIVGSDRTAANGDVCNKIGTYLKALAARDNGVPFYVALPGPSIDWSLPDGGGIPIEERDGREVATVAGRAEAGDVRTVCLTPPASPAYNPGFDVTPARLVTALITERGVTDASAEGLARLYPERRARA